MASVALAVELAGRFRDPDGQEVHSWEDSMRSRWLDRRVALVR